MRLTTEVRFSFCIGASMGAAGKGAGRSSFDMGICGCVDSESSGGPDGLDPM
jgi:hypothetical protein